MVLVGVNPVMGHWLLLRALRYLTVCAMCVTLAGRWLHLMASLLGTELWRDYRSASFPARVARMITVDACLNYLALPVERSRPLTRRQLNELSTGCIRS